MPSTKTTKKDAKPKATPTISKVDTSPQSESGLPLARYASILGTQSTLLIFTALYLPRSTSSLLEPEFLPAQASSLDRPQHPFLEPLTASPILTMGWLSFGVAIITVWWSGYMRVWEKGSEKGVDDVRVSELVRGRSAAISGAVQASTLAIPIYHALLILFGAPLTSHSIQTLLLATLLSLLTVYTPIYTFGLPSFGASSKASTSRLQYVRLFSEISLRSHLERALVFPSIGALVGCWVGAFVLPLDWDRPWQAWPLVPAYLAIFGYVLGSVVSFASSSVLSLASLDKTA